MNDRTLTVSELNNIIKTLIDCEPMLSKVCVRGELSNYKVYPSGHHYFTLKDAESSLRCVMFKSSASKLRFRPESGMGVTAFGRISVFQRDGAYQLYCTDLIPEGMGDLQIAYEQLKAKLAAEGLFDPAHKKKLPQFPEKIAIITVKKKKNHDPKIAHGTQTRAKTMPVITLASNDFFADVEISLVIFFIF